MLKKNRGWRDGIVGGWRLDCSIVWLFGTHFDTSFCGSSKMEALNLSFLKVLTYQCCQRVERRGEELWPIIAMDMGPCFNCSQLQVEDGDMQGHDLTHDAAENEVECCANCQRDAGWNGLEPSSSIGLGHFLIFLVLLHPPPTKNDTVLQ